MEELDRSFVDRFVFLFVDRFVLLDESFFGELFTDASSSPPLPMPLSDDDDDDDDDDAGDGDGVDIVNLESGVSYFNKFVMAFGNFSAGGERGIFQ